MADISKEIENFRSAVYGEEVRGSMISLAEKMNDVSEATEAAEKKRVVAETGRVNAEQTRVSQENDRVNAENERSRSEDARVSQENSRKSAEGSRVTAETGRTQAEKNRESQEGTRQLAESGRAEAEKVRVSQENERVKAETERADAEKTRGTAETNRINAEKKRQTDTAMAVRDCNTATDRANKAAQDAEDVVTGHGFILSSEKGAAGGVATLDTSGKVPDGQIPDIPAEKVIPDSIHRFVTDEEKKKWNIDVGELAPTFTQAANRTNLVSKEKIKISLGKIMKWFADLKAHAFASPVNNLLGTDANLALSAPMGKELDRKIAELNNKLTEQNKLLWYGDAISSGILACDTTGYTVFDVYCTDGVMLRGVKGYDTTNKRYFAMLGASGAANNRSQWVPAIWKGLIDIYDDHFYLHDITLYTIQDGGSYPQKQITSIYGVW